MTFESDSSLRDNNRGCAWVWQDHNDWKFYDEATTRILESAFNKSWINVHVTFGSTDYIIDMSDPLNMLQINTQVHRTLPNSNHAALAFDDICVDQV